MDAKRAQVIEQEKARNRYFDFLDKRIPELQAMGKPQPGPSPDGATIEQRMKRVVENAGESKFPGVTAREQADLEWGKMSADERIAATTAES